MLNNPRSNFLDIPSNTRKTLVAQDSFCHALEWVPGVKHHRPDDPPEHKNRLVLVPFDPLQAEEFFITSARTITIARELPGGPMRERYGIVCGVDGRNKTQFVLGGGKVQPDYNDETSDRLVPGEDRELVRGAAVGENREELKIVFANDDPGAYANYFLFGIRRITDRTPEGEVYVREEKSGLVCADACFLAICHDRLGNFEGQQGETGSRGVKPASELLRDLTRQERSENKLPIIPRAQATALAMSILVAREIWGSKMPPALKEVVADGERAAEYVASRSPYVKNFTKVIQEAPWKIAAEEEAIAA